MITQHDYLIQKDPAQTNTVGGARVQAKSQAKKKETTKPKKKNKLKI